MLVNTIQAEGDKRPPPKEEIPLKIHFEDLEGDQDSVFEKHCGGCHQLMTQIRGGLGHGKVAPNLSGLLSEFYPKNYPDQKEKAWTPKGLEAWLQNPRKLKGNTNMPPVKLKKEEMQKLIEILTDK